jgi:hypothetical protein
LDRAALLAGAVVFFADDFRAVVFLEVDFFAVDFLADVDFLAVDFFADRVVDFFAEVLDDDPPVPALGAGRSSRRVILLSRRSRSRLVTTPRFSTCD